jgi:hypothetical protein
MTCTCKFHTDPKGRERITLCSACTLEYRARHWAAVQSASHVYREIEDPTPELWAATLAKVRGNISN